MAPHKKTVMELSYNCYSILVKSYFSHSTSFLSQKRFGLGLSGSSQGIDYRANFAFDLLFRSLAFSFGLKSHLYFSSHYD